MDFLRHILFWTLLASLAVACAPTGDDDDSNRQTPDDDTDSDDDTSDDDDNAGGTPPSWSEPEQPLRSTRSLDGTWTFIPEGYDAREVPVPCFWGAQANWPGWEQYACPEYTVDTPDENREVFEGNGWENWIIRRGTYLLDLELGEPAPVTRIWFEALHHQATVYLNDQEIGSHIGAYRKAGFDLSLATQPGANELRVELADGHALLGEDGVTDWPAGYYAHTDITGIYRSVTLESLPAVYVDDVFLVPSVQRGDLTVQYTLVNSTSADTLVWLMARAVAADNNVELETAAHEVVVPANGQLTMVLVEPWPDPILWSPAKPHLYTWRTLLMNGSGEPVDLREDRFGFREVWIEDGHYMLNGQRMNLLGDSIEDPSQRPRYWGPMYFSCDTARDTLLSIKALNVNTVRWHQAPPPDCVYDFTDELGLLVISESAAYARTDILTPFSRSPEYVANTQTWIDGWVRRLRNHPSAVVWSLENEMYMYGFALSMDQITSLKWPVWQADSIVRPDGVTTHPRPVNWDGDSSWLWYFHAEKPETVNWHYPFARFFSFDPNVEWYDDALAHFAPYLIEDAPTGVGEFMVSRRSDWGDHTPDEAKSRQGIGVRAMRILGFSDMRPYHLAWAWHVYPFDGNDHPFHPYYHNIYSQEEKDLLVKIIRESYHPIAVFDYEYTRQPSNDDGTISIAYLPANTAIERELVVLNDSFLPGETQTVTWSVVDEITGQVLANGEFTLTVEQGGSERRTIAFPTPAAGHLITLYLQDHLAGLPAGDFTTEYPFVIVD